MEIVVGEAFVLSAVDGEHTVEVMMVSAPAVVVHIHHAVHCAAVILVPLVAVKEVVD